ncbi:phosphotransferase enzyme family protein [Deinococcus arboris]|uniref:phosphotransferase enzyme family protein n=1 Tax=Deinococcus arboris TaxID=2682977 RepID=UPI0012FABA29
MKAATLAGVWPIGTVYRVTPLGGGSINGAFQVDAGADLFHLRVYRDPRRERAERELAAVQVARAAGVPTPAPVPTQRGGVLARLGEDWAALFERAPGQPIPRADLNPQTAAALGAFLATVHDRLPPAVPLEVPLLAPPASVARTEERLNAVRAAILALPDLNTTDRWALTRLEQRLLHLRTAPLPDTVPDLPTRFLHGDYHDGNVLFSAGQPHALIDWEQTRLAPRAWELVRCLHLSLGLAPELCQAFLAAYRTRLPLSADEVQAGAALYATLQERNVWTLESVYLHGNPGPRAFIQPPPYVPFPVSWAQAEVT